MKLLTLKKEKDYRAEFMPSALEIIETPESPMGKVVIWTILSLLVILITWSIIGKVDEVAIAQGKIIPDGNIKVIQSLEGGVITAIHVEEGQHVTEGQLLIELDTTINQAELDKLTTSLETAKVERSILKAAMEGNVEAIERLIKENSHLNIDPDILLRQKELGVLIQSSQIEKQNALSTSVNQSGNELDIAKKNLSLTETKITILETEITKLKELTTSGAVPEKDLTDKENELLLTQQQKALQQSQIALYQSQVTGKVNDKTMNNVDYQKNLMEELVTKDKAIMDLSKEVEKIAKRLSLQIITAPVDGIVQGVGANTIGGIVSSEKPIVTIVPDNTSLVLEAMVLNKDIGFIHTGQQVDIKLDTFPFQKYGVLQGEIIHISPDAVEDEKKGYVYKIKVKPLTTTLRVEQKNMSISPGMTAEAEVKTGKRRIIEFFLPGIEEVKDGFELR